MAADPLAFAHPLLARWFRETYGPPTTAQSKAWPAIARGESTLLLAPTGSGKTLAAFLVALNRLLFVRDSNEVGTRVLYISPLKALGVDVERNLAAPLQGLCQAAAREGVSISVPRVGVRSGDTPAKERAQLVRRPTEILITTPESLYLMLSSRARQTLTHVDTVIIDEIHALSNNKRGAHLMLSLERLEDLRAAGLPALQRVGLSATQRPLDVIARLLGGGTWVNDEYRPRPVSVVDAGQTKRLQLRIESPGGEAAGDARWLAIHSRVLELVRAHRSTLVFVNNRRLAERTAAALNQLAETEIALAHHGSVAKETRAGIEARLKAGTLPAVVATASLELGIDMGAVDLVVQIEPAPSVAALLQRVGRAGHQVGATSHGVVLAKFRGDLLPSATLVTRALTAEVELTTPPQNPLDVLAQHVVSMLLETPLLVDVVFERVRRAAPFAQLARASFESVIDMLSGRYASPRYLELRPRINYDRVTGMLEARRGARLLVTANPGTIVDRGAYGVYLAGAEQPMRVGELDEEMVYESRVGDVFLLGSSAWRIEEIGFDRVLVSPAPGEPGRMPFWRGGQLGRSLELGRAMGALTRKLLELDVDGAERMLAAEHALDPTAARELVAYLHEQESRTAAPTDVRVVLELFNDEVGDWRAILLSSFGGRVHAPWCALVKARLQSELGLEVEGVWSDDGLIFRIPAAAEAPLPEWFFPAARDVSERLPTALAASPVFAAHFRENAARALLLPRRRPGGRVPLWVQRRRAQDLLSVAAEFPDFPIVLETLRECLRDVFDVPAFESLCRDIENGEVEACVRSPERASPFASALWLAFLGNVVYSQDSPLEQRARALQLDQSQLQLLLGEPELRELLDLGVIEQLGRELQRMGEGFTLRDADDVFDLLLAVGDLSLPELQARTQDPNLKRWLPQLHASGRAAQVNIAGEQRWIAAQSAGRLRDALGVRLPPGIPEALLGSVNDAVDDLVLGYARTHTPFTASAVALRWGLESPLPVLNRLVASGQLVQGAFLPGGTEPEYCDPEVLRRLKAKSLALLRRQIEAVPAEVYARFLLEWQHVSRPLRGSDGLLEVLEPLQGIALPYATWVNDVLPARNRNFSAHDLDELCARGELMWRGMPSSAQEPKLAFYLPEHYALLAPEAGSVEDPLAQRLKALLEERGALFFADLVSQLEVFAGDVFNALWELVAAGEVHNDTLLPVRSLLQERTQRKASGGRERPNRAQLRSFGLPGTHPSRGGLARLGLGSRSERAGSEGRWVLLPRVNDEPTARLLAQAEILLRRFGVLTREGVRGAEVDGGFGHVYPLLRSLEEAGKIRRGYFISAEGPDAVGANQFAWPGAEARLRALRDRKPSAELLTLAAVDPANPYGLVLSWPEHPDAKPSRSLGSSVVLDQGGLLAWLSKDATKVSLYASATGDALERLAQHLVRRFEEGTERAWLIEGIDSTHPRELLASGVDAAADTASAVFARALQGLGFRLGHAGLQKLREPRH